MCAAYEYKGVSYRPGRLVFALGPGGAVRHVWAGFAREEILPWWLKKGALLLDIPAMRFAERSVTTGKLSWGEVTHGCVLRGLLDQPAGKEPIIRVVTRAATDAERARFDHPRMPVIAAPLHQTAAQELHGIVPEEQQEFLF